MKLKSTNRAFRVPKTVTMTVPARGFASRKFKVTVGKKARGRARITAVKNGWPGHAYLKVKPKKKVRKR